MTHRISWLKSFFERTGKSIAEWDRKRIEEDEHAKVQREKIRAILLDGTAQANWSVQRNLPD